MAVYEITSFRGALSDYEDKGPPGSFKFGTNLDIRKKIDSLSCTQALVDETGVTFSGLIRWIVEATDGNSYGFADDGTIYKRTSAGVWSLVHTDADGDITGAEEWQSSTGKTYLYWCTATKLNRKELPGLSNWSDVNADAGWPKTDLTSYSWHTMKRVSGDMLIANKNTVGLIGYDESYSKNVLDLIPGNYIKTIIERFGRAYFGTHHPSTPLLGVNAVIDTEVPLAQIGNDGEIYFTEMSNSLPITRFPGGGRVNPGGVDTDVAEARFFEWQHSYSVDPDINTWIDKKNIARLAYFGVYNADTGKGGIYSYGRKRKNHPFVLNLEHLFDSDEIGATKMINGTLVFSYKSGASNGIKAVDSSNKATGTYEGLDFKAPIKVPASITIWNSAEILCDALPAGTTIQFWYRLDKNGSFIQAKMADGTTDFTTDGETVAVFLIGEKGQIFEPKIVLTPTANTGPEVFRIRIFFN